MDKYDELFEKYEGKWKKDTVKTEKEYFKIISKFIEDNYEEIPNIIEIILKENSVSFILSCLKVFPEDIQYWLKNNIITTLNKESIMFTYMQTLSNILISKEQTILRNVIDSFIASGLIKNIELVKDILIMTMPDNKKIKFTNIFDSKKEKDSALAECHNICYDIVKNLDNNINNVQCITILEKNMYGFSRFHSFIVREGIVYDYARNMIISFNNYQYLFNPQIISCTQGQELIENIKKIEETDEHFKNNNMCKVLKYAIHEKYINF